MRLALAVVVAGSAGCAQLFGIDETTGADANTDLATVQVQRVSVGATVIETPQDMSMQMAQFVQADGVTTVPGELAAMDTFAADVPGTPPVIYTVPDMTYPTRMLALPARNQLTNYLVYEHPNPQPPFANSQLQVNVTLPSPYVTGEGFAIQAIGAWMSKNLSAELPAVDTGATTIASTIDYSTLNPIFTGLMGQRVRITMNDVVLLLRYTGLRLSGVFEAQFEQTDGPDPMTGVMLAVSATSMVEATVTPAEYQTRFSAVRPAVGTQSMSWSIWAAPGHSVGSDDGVRLNQTAVAADATTLTLPYSNPFESRDWASVVTFVASANRSYPISDGTNTVNVVLFARQETLSPPGTTPLSYTMPAGLPTTVRANQTLLTNDGMMLTVDRTQPVVIDAITDRPSNTVYELTLVELSIMPDATGASLVRRIALDAFTAGEPSFAIPPDLLEPGKTYYISFKSVQGGYVNAATGDLQTVTLPYSTASLDSAVFTVMP